MQTNKFFKICEIPGQHIRIGREDFRPVHYYFRHGKLHQIMLLADFAFQLSHETQEKKEDALVAELRERFGECYRQPSEPLWEAYWSWLTEDTIIEMFGFLRLTYSEELGDMAGLNSNCLQVAVGSRELMGQFWNSVRQ